MCQVNLENNSNFMIMVDLSSAQPEGSILVNGGGAYAEKMFMEIIIKFSYLTITALLDSNKGTNKYINNIILKNNIKVYFYNNNIKMSEIINKECPDIIFFPVCYPKYSSVHINDSIKVIATIHDLSSIYASQWGFIKERYIDTIKNNIRQLVKSTILKKYMYKKYIEDQKSICLLNSLETIITDSEYSRSAIQKYVLELRKSFEIMVLYPFLFNRQVEVSDLKVLQKFNLEQGMYYFFASGSRWHKNNYFAIKAIDKEIQRGHSRFADYKYIVSGIDNMHMKYYKKHIKSNNFIYTGYLSKPIYNLLIQKARGFIYPSLFEGFGAPPVEAMRFGTVPICSNLTSIPEICGKAAIYFSPDNVNSFLRAVEKSFDDKKIDILSKYGKERFKYIFERQYGDLEKLLYLLENFIQERGKTCL